MYAAVDVIEGVEEMRKIGKVENFIMSQVIGSDEKCIRQLM